MRIVVTYFLVGCWCAGLLACSNSAGGGAGIDTGDASSQGTQSADGTEDASAPDAAPGSLTDVPAEPDGLLSADTPESPDVNSTVDALGAADVALAADAAQTPDADLLVDGTQDIAPLDEVAPTLDAAAEVLEMEPEVLEIPDADETGVPDGVTGVPEELWLFSVHTQTNTLLKVDVETGTAEAWCTLPETMTNYPSLTFDRNNQLLASRAAKPWGLDLIDPCTCTVDAIGQYGNFTEVNGITASHGFDLFGIASAGNQLISISSQTAEATSVGVLAAEFTTGGATWSDEVNALYAINGGDDALYTIDPDTAATLGVIALDHDFGTVGMERHPLNGVVYACSTAGDLLEVDPDTGAVATIGPMGWEGACTNLAAPFGLVPCVDGE
ncbi:MAG: hypothetical protein QF464_05335 [Myxococcota bacterium]|nr:hypothetical protein [Myxococcota bacterium]